MERQEFLPLLRGAFLRNGLSLSEENEEKLYLLADRLLTVNAQFNLTAIKDPGGVALLHMADCAMAAASLPQGARIIDVGCGGGFPSLPLAILRPDLSITAMDATAKKVAYVKETAEYLGLSGITALCGRAEELARQKEYREAFDGATARAVAALPVLCELCLPFVRVGGFFLALKGRNAKEEWQAAKGAIGTLGGETERFSEDALLGEGESFSRAEILIRKVKATPEGYPRAYGRILKKPL